MAGRETSGEGEREKAGTEINCRPLDLENSTLLCQWPRLDSREGSHLKENKAYRLLCGKCGPESIDVMYCIDDVFDGVSYRQLIGSYRILSGSRPGVSPPDSWVTWGCPAIALTSGSQCFTRVQMSLSTTFYVPLRYHVPLHLSTLDSSDLTALVLTVNIIDVLQFIGASRFISIL